jgi:threonine/homoserine/homoserine lactone efflux protein
MTLSLYDMWLYALALFVLFLTPGPVWVAIIARAVSNGFHGAWPLATGVALGDFIWPLAAMAGVSVLVSLNANFLDILALITVVIFFTMGIMLIRHADRTPERLSRLTRAGFLAGFSAGLLVIIGNPKAMLFYMGVLPGFFDLSIITMTDALMISLVSMAVPLMGNLVLGVMVGKSRGWLHTPGRIKRLNTISGIMLIGVGMVILIGKISS